MLATFARFSALTTLLATVAAAPAYAAQVHVGVQIGGPAPVIVAQPPVYGGPVVAPYGSFWVPGYYVRTFYGPRWVPGRWVRGHVPRGHAYGYWRNREREWDRRGDWDRRRRDRDDWRGRR